MVAATASSYAALVLGRLVTGVAVGLYSSTIFLYSAELSPPHIRGKLATSNQVRNMHAAGCRGLGLACLVVVVGRYVVAVGVLRCFAAVVLSGFLWSRCLAWHPLRALLWLWIPLLLLVVVVLLLLVLCIQLFVCVGVLFGYIVDKWVVNWRYALASGIPVAAVLCVCFLFVTPRSPRWLVKKGRCVHALKTLCTYRQSLCTSADRPPHSQVSSYTFSSFRRCVCLFVLLLRSTR